MGKLRMEVLLQAIDKASGPLKRIMAGGAGTSRSIRDAKQALRELQRQSGDITAFAKARAALKGVGRDLDVARGKQTELIAAIEREKAAQQALMGKRNAARAALKQQTQAMQTAGEMGHAPSVTAIAAYDRLKRLLAAV